MAMTLEELRDQIASLEGDDSRRKAWVASLDAHLAGVGEAVAWRIDYADGSRITVYEKPEPAMFRAMRAPITPLYTAPPTIDIAAVREVIAALRSIGNDHHDAWADKLTAALPKETP